MEQRKNMEENAVNPKCKLLVIGGSAGSLEVLMQLLPALYTLPSFALVIVLHRKTAEDLLLEELLAMKTSVPVKEVEDKTLLLPGNIYVVPSDYHLLFEKDSIISLDVSEKVNYSRPSIDVVFESAAEMYGSDVVGILLSGANNDGTEGMKSIKQNGGITIAQQPESAEMPFMPKSAIVHSDPDYILDVEALIAYILLINT